jgi:hypothetical protein
MDRFLESVASNAALATLLAAAAVVVARFVRRPEVVYWLWLLVFNKLLTPPVFPVPISPRGQTATPRPTGRAAEHTAGTLASRDATVAVPAAPRTPS